MPAASAGPRRWAPSGALLLLGVLAAEPAAAHPFGPPLAATLDRSGTVLTMTWTGAADDWMVVGEHTGAFAEVAADSTGAEVLATSPLVRDYLADHIRVATPGGRSCDQEVEEVDDVLADGARLTFTCPEGTSDVLVTLAVLTDVNPAYRTVLEAGDDGARTLFTAARPTHQVSLAGSGSGPVGASLALVGGALAVGALAAVGVPWALRRRRAAR
ncbi:hypothetical protein ACI3EY_14105 [Ornithinimicrobium sp. LYQ92]|uniref:hypothetical protein n=1 Tax=Serinicoccus sp. LYQ92 TaxID=3378798 RepID=UPI003852D206